MKATLVLKVTCSDKATAKKLSMVLAPDNRGFPSDQRFSMAVGSGSLSFTVESERATSDLTTVLGILRDIALFQEIWLLSRGSPRQGER